MRREKRERQIEREKERDKHTRREKERVREKDKHIVQRPTPRGGPLAFVTSWRAAVAFSASISIAQPDAFLRRNKGKRHVFRDGIKQR